MKNSLTALVGALLIIIFVLLLFTFQVRQTEIALVTTFDKPSGYITEPGFRWKWPPPIQNVIKFDKRVQNFDQDKIEQTLTKDNFNVDVQVYVGWTISKPDLFFSSFPAGTVAAAQPALESLIRGAKSAVVGKYVFSNFVSTDTNELKFVEIEQEMLKRIQGPALNNYGIEVRFLGIKKLALPESVTQKVFDRMTQERKREVERLQAMGEGQAAVIRSDADRERDKLRAEANAQATRIRGEADAEAAKSFAVFDQEPDLAMFIYKLRAIEEVGKQKTTYFLDTRTSPFDLLTTNLWQRSLTNQLQHTNAGVPGIAEEGKGAISGPEQNGISAAK
jgi:membrane protease subunit HflC